MNTLKTLVAQLKEAEAIVLEAQSEVTILKSKLTKEYPGVELETILKFDEMGLGERGTKPEDIGVTIDLYDIVNKAGIAIIDPKDAGPFTESVPVTTLLDMDIKKLKSGISILGDGDYILTKSSFINGELIVAIAQ